MIPKSKAWIIACLALIIIMAGGLRLCGLPSPPAGPYYDEAANGILADNIANGGYRPVFIASYTGKEVLFFYLAALLTKLIGPGVMALRLTSALLGTFTILATAWCAYELFRSHQDENPGAPAIPTALLAAALLGGSFWHLSLSRIGLRAVAQPLLQALTLAALWRGLSLPSSERHANRWARGTLVVAGVLYGLTGYTYLAARLFPVPVTLALLALLIVDRAHWKRRLTELALFHGAAVITLAPLGLYFVDNPERFVVRLEQVAAQGPALTLPQAMIQALGIFFVAGDPLPRLNLPGKPIFGPLLAVAFVLGIALTLWAAIRRGQGTVAPLTRARHVLLLSWIPLMILPTALTLSDIIPHYLRAAGLLPLITIFPVVSILWMLDQLGQRWTPVRALLQRSWFMGVIPCLVIAVTATAAAQDMQELGERTDHYEIADGDLVDMATWLNQATPKESGARTPVYVASIHYRHPTLALLARDYASFKWLTGGQTLVAPATEDGILVVPRSVDMSWAQTYLAQAAEPESPPPLGPDSKPAFLAYLLPADLALPVSGEASADFSHVIHLDGYELRPMPGNDGTVDVILRWQVLNPAPRDDLITAIHLVDAFGLLWTQTNPFQYPSSQWTPGERFLDRFVLQLPVGTPPGPYVLRVSLFSPSAGTNLNIVKPDGGFGGTAVQLPLTLAPGPTSTEPFTVLWDIREQIDAQVAPGLTLVGVNLDTQMAQTREPIHLALFWDGQGALEDMTVRVWLDQQLLSNARPAHGHYPTSYWRPSEKVIDRYSLRVPLDTTPGEHQLLVDVSGPQGTSDRVLLGTVTVSSPERSFVLPSLEHTADAQMGEPAELAAYDLTLDEEGTLQLTLAWRALQETETDYTVFIHLRSGDGTLIGQADSMPHQGAYPTSLWAAGEVVLDTYQIPFDPGAAGPLTVSVGMYLPLSGQQLGDAYTIQGVRLP